MAVTFIHTSDWQLRKSFRVVDGDTMARLQSARLDVITRIGKLAVSHEAAHVLVAGDVYDVESVTDVALMQPIERMKAFPSVTWHLLPGNHDPERPFGIWARLKAAGIPDNIVLHTTPQPWVSPDNQLAVLPAPLNFKSTVDDPTAYMDATKTEGSTFRVGLAHGSVTTFGSDEGAASNYIEPRRPEFARLDYLALGDWHGQKDISDRVRYSGTPETDSFSVDNGGQVLLVTLIDNEALPKVEKLPVGEYAWHTDTVQLSSDEDIEALDKRIRGLGENLSRHLVYLRITGALSLDGLNTFDRTIRQQLAAAVAYLRIDDDDLYPAPTEEDLDRIEKGGFVRVAADRLAAMAADDGHAQQATAKRALQRLYIEHMKIEVLAS